jgi:hypothetical protein
MAWASMIFKCSPNISNRHPRMETTSQSQIWIYSLKLWSLF